MALRNFDDRLNGLEFMEEEDKKLLQKELSTWAKKIPLIVGFEAVAEALMGRGENVHFLIPEKMKNGDHDASESFEKEHPALSIDNQRSSICCNSSMDLDFIPGTCDVQLQDGMGAIGNSISTDFPLDLRTSDKIFHRDEPKRSLEEPITFIEPPANNTRRNSDRPSRPSRRDSTDPDGSLGFLPISSGHPCSNISKNNNNNKYAIDHCGDSNLTDFYKPIKQENLSWQVQSSERETHDHSEMGSTESANQCCEPLFGHKVSSGLYSTGDSLLAGKRVTRTDESGTELGNRSRSISPNHSKAQFWKNEGAPLDHSRTEFFENLGIASSDGSTSAEESPELFVDRCTNDNLFQMNNKIERLLMSVITKNILEKYQQVRSECDPQHHHHHHHHHHHNHNHRHQPLPDKNNATCGHASSPALESISSKKGGHFNISSRSASLSKDSNVRPKSIVIKDSFAPLSSSTSVASFHSASGYADSCPPSSGVSSSIVTTSSIDTPPKKSRPKRGQYRRYNRQLLLEAVRAVQQGNMSVHRAGSYFGVPHSTLEYKVKERHLLRNKKSGQDQRQKSNVGFQGCSDKSIPSYSVQPSLYKKRSPSDCPVEAFIPTKLRCITKDSELKNYRAGSADPANNFRHPLFNDVLLRNSGMPLFYPGIFEGIASPYSWLTRRFSKSPVFPVSQSMLSAFFPVAYPNPMGGMDAFNPASEMLRHLNSKVHPSEADPSLPSANNDDSSEPHSTSSLEIDLRINKTLPE